MLPKMDARVIVLEWGFLSLEHTDKSFRGDMLACSHMRAGERIERSCRGCRKSEARSRSPLDLEKGNPFSEALLQLWRKAPVGWPSWGR